ncbi:MAG: hypothetical protein LBL85_00540 [Methanocalculaceae archaeon]|nr:hypothetical protein [Methanocalculaceae archaeon]
MSLRKYVCVLIVFALLFAVGAAADEDGTAEIFPPVKNTTVPSPEATVVPTTASTTVPSPEATVVPATVSTTVPSPEETTDGQESPEQKQYSDTSKLSFPKSGNDIKNLIPEIQTVQSEALEKAGAASSQSQEEELQPASAPLPQYLSGGTADSYPLTSSDARTVYPGSTAFVYEKIRINITEDGRTATSISYMSGHLLYERIGKPDCSQHHSGGYKRRHQSLGYLCWRLYRCLSDL